MKKSFFLLSYIFVFIFLFSCSKNKYINELTFEDDGLCVISNWQLIGPFDYDTLKQLPDETFFNKDLNKLGVDEEHFEKIDLKVINQSDVSTQFIEEKYVTHRLKNLFAGNIRTKSNYYLATTLLCEKDTLVYALMDGSGAYKIWVNQQEIYQERFRKNQTKICDRFIPVHLQKGENIILAKVNRESNVNAWGLDLAFAPQNKAFEIYRANYFENFIYNPVFSNTITFYSGPLSPAKSELRRQGTQSHFKTTIDENGNHFVAGIEKLSDGFFSFSFESEGTQMEQIVFKGDIREYYESLCSLAPIVSDTLVQEELTALKKRIDFLFENYDDRGRSAIKYYDTNLVHWVNRLRCFLKSKKEYTEKLSLKAYMGGNSGEIGYYGFQTDSGLLDEPDVPLIVVMPFAIPYEYFPTAWYIGNYEQLFVDAHLASQRGFAICFLYGAGENYTLSALKDEFFGVLGNIESQFPNVNTEKIYLTGICKGASKSFELAVECPGLIQAIAVRTPLPEVAMIDGLSKLKGIPIFVRHGKYDSQIPMDYMETLVAKIERFGADIEFVQTAEAHDSYRKDERRVSFDFFESVYESIDR
ncbi:MAG: dienelactone hydrolase family protein [Prolixibacteraceae bacterium]|nr:dienelactone hydrolase family protein [Prolixibacteraceae bacterium]